MSAVRVRPFRRGDRDQLTMLVNAHAEAVVPGMNASVSAVLASLERRPGEFIEDPWVSERVTLVAEQLGRVVAAAHLLRYFPDERAGPAARDAGEVRWLLYWPQAPAGNPCWPDATARTTTTTGPSCPPPGSASSPAPNEAGPGHGKHDHGQFGRYLARTVPLITETPPWGMGGGGSE